MQTNNYHHQQKPFVYLWRDRLSNRYYLGYHCGKNPRYICSSKYMKKEYKARPTDFTRRILATGTRDEMGALEKRLLHTRKKHLGERYYNLATSFPILHWTDQLKKNQGELSRKRMANMTAEQKKQMRMKTSKSRAGISYKPSKEQREKISFWNKNAWSTGFFKDRKGSGTKKGTKFSFEHRKKISEAIKQKWASRA
jgi:hypothetical protein